MHLRGHGAKVPINSLVAQLERMDKEEGLAWFRSQEVESTPAEYAFEKELAKTAWEVGHLETFTEVAGRSGRVEGSYATAVDGGVADIP